VEYCIQFCFHSPVYQDINKWEQVQQGHQGSQGCSTRSARKGLLAWRRDCCRGTYWPPSQHLWGVHQEDVIVSGVWWENGRHWL